MDYKKYFQEKNIDVNDLSPKIKSGLTNALKGFWGVLYQLLILYVGGMILFIAKASGIFFIVFFILLMFGWFIHLFYFYGIIGEKWRKNRFEKWFHASRLSDLFEYLERKNMLDLKIINKRKDIFENKFLEKIAGIDYLFEPSAGTRVLSGSPSSVFNKNDFEEYSHYFSFIFSSEKYANLVGNIGFCGNQRKKFAAKNETWKYKLDMTQPAFSSQANIPQIKELMEKIENILLQYPNLKGYLDFKKDNLIEITLYDNFKIITQAGRHPHQKFIRNENIATAFDGFEKIVELL